MLFLCDSPCRPCIYEKVSGHEYNLLAIGGARPWRVCDSLCDLVLGVLLASLALAVGAAGLGNVDLEQYMLVSA
jgi:hypothetical protein